MKRSAASSSSAVVTPGRAFLRRISWAADEHLARRGHLLDLLGCLSVNHYLSSVLETLRSQCGTYAVVHLVGRAGAVEAVQHALVLVPLDRAARSGRGRPRGACGRSRACRRRAGSGASRPGRRRPRASAGRTPRGRRACPWRRCGARTGAAPPRRRAPRSAAPRSAPGRGCRAVSSSISAWPIVRGKPSSRKPSSASPESNRSAITSQISSSGTSSPASMYSLAFLPSSDSSATASRRMIPVE